MGGAERERESKKSRLGDGWRGGGDVRSESREEERRERGQREGERESTLEIIFKKVNLV